MRSLMFFILLVTPSIIVHELAHLLVALYFGLPALTFSIGFGAELFGFDWLGIHWQLSAIPLGGYVEFPQELAVFTQPSGRENEWLLVALAGPFSNFSITFSILFSYFFVLLRRGFVTQASVNGDNGFLLSLKLSSLTSKFYSPKTEHYHFFLGATSALSITDLSTVIKNGDSKKLSLFGSLKLTVSFVSQIVKGVPGLAKEVLKHSSKKDDNPVFKNHSGLLGPFSLGSIGVRAKEQSWAMFFVVTAILNISLGVFNLLPLAVLDGGKALSLIIIKFSGDISGTSNDIYTSISFILVAGITLYALVKDLFKRNN